MRTLISIFTILFVVGSIYYLVKVNNVPELAEQYYKQYSANLDEVKSELPGTLSTITKSISTSLPSVAPALKQALPLPAPIAINVPGAIQKIETAITPNASIKTAAPAASNTQVATGTGSTLKVGVLSVQGIIADTNSNRTDQSVAKLTESAMLDASAQAKANDMLAQQYFEHTNPQGKTVSDLVAAQGYTYIKIGENLALGDFTSDDDVVTAWMNSPEHRANILDPDFTDIGIGIAYGEYQGHDAYLVVQHFGRPRSSCPDVSSALDTEVVNGQASLDAQVTALNTLKNQIDQGRAEGQNMNSEVDTYNADLDAYNQEYTQIDALRTQYNAEVTAFNSCITSSN